MKVVGILLILLGAAALIYGGFSYNRQRTVLDVGGIKATATEHKSIPISPIVGAVALIGGIALVLSRPRRA